MPAFYDALSDRVNFAVPGLRAVNPLRPPLHELNALAQEARNLPNARVIPLRGDPASELGNLQSPRGFPVGSGKRARGAHRPPAGARQPPPDRTHDEQLFQKVLVCTAQGCWARLASA